LETELKFLIFIKFMGQCKCWNANSKNGLFEEDNIPSKRGYRKKKVAQISGTLIL